MKRIYEWIAAHLLALLTGKDNKTLDPARVTGFVALVVVTIWAIYKLVTHDGNTSIRDIAEAYGLTAVGTGGGAALTNSSQPPTEG